MSKEELMKMRTALKVAGITYQQVASAHGCRDGAVSRALNGLIASRGILATAERLLAEKKNQPQTVEVK